MSLGLMLYLANVSDKLVQVAAVLSVVLGFATVIISIWNIMARYEQIDKNKQLEFEHTYNGPAADRELKRAMARLEEAKDAVKLSDAWLKRTTVSAAVVLFLSIVVPSSKNLYIIYGAGVAEDIVKNPKVQETGGKILEVINKKLEDLMEEKKK